ncbi:MAG: adenylate kinase [Prochlorococcus sp. MED-G132]|uniref:Adenylate kinase n=1 Tax=Prochlorococcus marinus (strain MIT 9303) TaxID=59922 RepID=KAD_PROM3|nr:adenylate kinase [Prochlorococcus marinus]A2CC47.1 RecName: Full=Adenylate kinase; Short=AK; AltName: Full=ATP-AMP transphosphorylase; AltName: Full=ATP:AMP phosphotransferase; AltName: Full=Adenylate monophosphate kinase [Prochlorococcus marinus str. MIT 9303]ABM79057.1 Adenylate kinase [Prochlorococcus marinus str. MIT 9303]RZO51944.1 MAG: adenylate kinase [Prochlorococcus sp. MED-G132]
MKQRLLFLGPPGAGKGTQAERLCAAHELMHLSTGDLLRAEVGAKTPLGQEAAAVMNRGELVSDELVLAIVENQLKNQSGGWLLDGFPRTLIQATALEPLLEELKQPIEAVVLLELNDAVLIERLISRGRSDDNESVIRNRLEVYREKTAPLIDHYRQQGLLQTVEAQGSIESIAISIEKSLC